MVLDETQKLSSAGLKDVKACYCETLRFAQIGLDLIAQSVDGMVTTWRMREEKLVLELTFNNMQVEIQAKIKHRRKKQARQPE
jgi:hypothetical protein